MGRLIWVDNAKTLLIFLVVVGHTMGIPMTTSNIIYSFHMPAFFVISGFLYKQRAFIKDLSSFVLPTIVFSLLRLLFLFLYNDNLYIGDYSFFPYRFDRHPALMGGYWYLYVLFFIQVIMRFINKINHKYYLYFAVACFILTVVYDDCNILLGRAFDVHRVICSFPFFAIGLYLSEIKYSPNINKIYLPILIIVGIFISVINGSTALRSFQFGYSYALFFICALIHTVVIFNGCAYIPQTDFCKTISIGTLLVLGTHMSVIDLFAQVTIIPFSFLYILVPIITLVFCYPLIKISLRFCPWVLGKFPRKSF